MYIVYLPGSISCLCVYLLSPAIHSFILFFSHSFASLIRSAFLFLLQIMVSISYLSTAFSFSFSDKHRLRSCRRPNICFSMGGTIRDLGESQKQDEGTLRNATKISGDQIVPNSNLQIHVEDVDSPLVSALKASAVQDSACFHFPGHNRGRAAPSSLTRLIGTTPFLHDLPELPELDNLFSPQGAILNAQKQAAKLFGSSHTWFLVGGSTCGVQAAIMATCSPGDLLILPRNSHISAISAMVLSGVLPKYIIPEYNSKWDVAGGVTRLQVEKAIKELEIEGRTAAAVFVTSPTYHGICSDVSEIKELCHSNGIPLIVDEAHGAHLGFHRNLPKSALEQGADIVVQSTHKVLSSLTQSSMLHMSGNMVDTDMLCRCLQVLQSTSPSYLLLASLDAARAQLEENPETIFDEAMELAVDTVNMIKRMPGISVLGISSFSNFAAIDPLRLSVGVWRLGLSGYEADNILFDEFGVIPELVGSRSLTFAFNLGTSRKHVQRLVSGLQHLSATFNENIRTDEERAEADGNYAPFRDITISLSPREAFFASKSRVSANESIGEICGELICPYPPGIPVLFPGEIITKNALNYLLQVKGEGAEFTGASDPSLSTVLVCR